MTVETKRSGRSILSSRKWVSYAVAAGSAVAAWDSQTAEGDIVVVDVGAANGGSLSAQQGSAVPYQLNNADLNGVFVFSHYNFSTAASTGGALFVAAGGGFVGNAAGYVSNLAPGDIISNAASFQSNAQGTLAYISGAYGQFQDAGTGFVGFRFTNAQGTQHGWVEVTTNGSPLNSFVVERYAFTTEGEQLAAGSTVAVPEPGSVGLLALGALGLIRRRRGVAESEQE